MSDPTTPTPEEPDYDPGPEIAPNGPDEAPQWPGVDPGEWRPHDTAIGIMQMRMELF